MSLEIQTEIDYLRYLQSRGNTDEFLKLKIEMLCERSAHYTDEFVRRQPTFQASATKNYLLACVARYPGLTRSELRELAGIPGSPKRSSVDVFRDYLIQSRRELFVDINGRLWIKTDFGQSPIAKIGNVIIDGRITSRMKRALCFFRDNPGATAIQLQKALKLNSTELRSLLTSLKTRTIQNAAGGFYVDGYIPETMIESVPEKQKVSRPSVLDEMAPGVAYDWGQLVPIYRSNNMTGRDGLQHLMKLVAAGVVRSESGKFVNVRSDI